VANNVSTFKVLLYHLPIILDTSTFMLTSVFTFRITVNRMTKEGTWNKIA
jgi:hypothetical protein